jgi:hypothetical protein
MDNLNGNDVTSQLLQIAIDGNFMGLFLFMGLSFLQQELPG